MCSAVDIAGAVILWSVAVACLVGAGTMVSLAVHVWRDLW